MRDILFICGILALSGCSGSLSEKERKAVKKELEIREIKKVSEEEVFQKALEIGRMIAPDLKGGHSPDSLAISNGVKIIFGDTLSTNVSTAHRKIIEAYFYAPDKRTIGENVQNSGDTLIYSAPIIVEEKLKEVLFIEIPRKKIILSL